MHKVKGFRSDKKIAWKIKKQIKRERNQKTSSLNIGNLKKLLGKTLIIIS